MGKQVQENVFRQIPALLTAERVLGNNPRVWQRLDLRRDVPPTSFANDDKGMDAGRWAVKHEYSIGEYKAKISTIP
jgi:hypothetical protein